MRRRTISVSAAALALLVTGAARGEEGSRGRHPRIFAVPAPKSVKIDGRLEDWDLSGSIDVCVADETAGVQGARFAILYDREALYLGAVVRDPNPMMNRHDPRVTPEQGWDADACQFRMVLDPKQGYPVNQSSFDRTPNDQMVHMILWHYTDRQEPCLQLAYGFDFALPAAGWPKGVVPRDKFQAAYRKGEDGRSYAFEYRIPWSTLAAKSPPAPGDLVAGTVQFNWSRPDGLKTAGGSAWAYDVMGRAGFPFQESGCWGKIVFARQGNLPEQLTRVTAGPVEQPLPLQFQYDLPGDGEVTVVLFDAQGRMARNLVVQAARRAGHVVEKWDGLDDRGQPLPAGEYSWKGLYHGPITTKFLLSVHNSGQPPYPTADNRGGWGGDHGTAQDIAAAGDAMVLAWNVCEAGWGILRTDLEGRRAWGSKATATYLATDGKRIFASGGHGFHEGSGVEVMDLADGRPLIFGRGTPKVEVPAGGDKKSNRVTGLAFGGGRLHASYAGRNLVAAYDPDQGNIVGKITVDSPDRLAARPDGSLVAVSGNRVLALRGGKASVLAADHLDGPAGIAVDAQGNLYVANTGKLQNVAVFSPEGKYLRSIGRAGGRPAKGRYDPAGMLQPGGLAVDKQGRLWVAETLDYPKRISVWEAATGKLLTEFFGGSAYSPQTWMDPKKPDEVYCHNVIWKVDLDRGTWRPYSTVWRATAPNMVPAPGPGGYPAGMRVLTANNGRQYAWGGAYPISPVLYLRRGDLFVPLLAGITVNDNHVYTPWPPCPLMRDIKEYPNGQYFWIDADDDQTIGRKEIARAEGGHGVFFHWVDAELNLWCGGGFVFRPKRIEPDGRPVYDFTRPEKITASGTNGHGPIFTDPVDGSIYTNAPERDPGFARWSPGGKLLWGYRRTETWPKAINRPALGPGDLWGITCPLGVAGDFVGIATYFGPSHLFTRDGLYVAMLLRDGRLGQMGPDVLNAETFNGQFVRLPGGRYLLLNGDQDGRVSEVLGLETVKRLPGGTVTLSAEDAGRAADALAEFQRRKARAQPLVIVRGRGSLDLARGVGKALDDARKFTARVAYDAKSLYLRYDVSGPAELVNAAPDPRLIFKGGNLIDLQLATDPTAPEDRKRPAPGDVRLLVSRREGKPVAVRFRPKVRGFAGEPIVLRSPTGTESFDAIEPVEGVAVDYRKTPAGFTAVVTIPLDVLGWRPQAGATVKLDLGYVFGNPAGSQAAQRAYWSNNSFTANVTGDVPHESRLEPHEWGTATVE